MSRRRTSSRTIIFILAVVAVLFVARVFHLPSTPPAPAPVAMMTLTLPRDMDDTGDATPDLTPEALAQGTLAGTMVTGESCHAAGGLPDRRCTPGAVDERVTQANIRQTVCRSGYTKTVRPPVSYTGPLKRKLMARYGLSGLSSDYQLDHLIPLSLGGNPTSELNLWPEAIKANPAASEKDEVEYYLYVQVCDGKMTLAAAQAGIRIDWRQYYPVPR